MAEHAPLTAWMARWQGRAVDVDRRTGRDRPTWAVRRTTLVRRLPMIVQLALAAALAWLFARYVLDHPQPFFAPVAAILTISAGAGRRRTVAYGMLVGVALGIVAGEVVVALLGRGALGIGTAVLVAAVAAALLGLTGVAQLQSSTSAILIAAVAPVSDAGSQALDRFLDAVVGGILGLVLVALVPSNPVRALDREVQTVLRGLAASLDRTAGALRVADAGVAWTALEEARALQPSVDALLATATSASEVSRLSPWRWRTRGHVTTYTSTIRDIDNAVRDARVLARRTSVLLRHGEPPPEGVDQAVSSLAVAVRIFSDDLAEQDRFDEAQSQLVYAARLATVALPGAASINSSSVVAQVRSLAADLLFATGSTVVEVDRWFGPEEGEDPDTV